MHKEINLFLEIEYLGTKYFGFQIQNKKIAKEISIQGVIEDSLKRLFNQEIRLNCSGRTDKSVHAKGQVLNFKVKTKIPINNIKIALNSFLPQDIRIKQIKKVPLEFHARFSAKSKIYRYIILNQKQPSVFLSDFSWYVSGSLNINKMKKVSKLLEGERDFSLFAKEPRKYKHCIRTVKYICIKKRGTFIYIDIEANGFLRNMVRNIVSFLVSIGLGKVKLQDVNLILDKKIKHCNNPAPGGGLYLSKVKYK